MKANFEENTIALYTKSKEALYYVGKCFCFDYHIKNNQIRIACQVKLHTKLKHCKTTRVPVCILSDDVTKYKNTLYGNHMKANFEENTILMYTNSKEVSYYAGKYCSFDFHIKNIQIRIVGQVKVHTGTLVVLQCLSFVCNLT